jgi:hypothetical protein
LAIHSRQTAPTPAGFAVIVSAMISQCLTKPDRASFSPESGKYSVLLFLAQFLESGIGAQRVPKRIEP